MIAVVCLNPAVDVTHEVASVDWDGVNRPHTVHVRPGGKGVNVARTLAALGAEVTLLGLAGGGTGSELTGGLAGRGIALALTPIGNETRRTFTVVDAGRGQAALFNEPGPAISAGEYAAFLLSYEKSMTDCAAVVLSGSLPRQVGHEAYAGLVAIARAASVPVILDTSGPALALGAAAGPDVVKPNLAELAWVCGGVLSSGDGIDLAAVSRAAGSLLPAGGTAVVSLGADGLLTVTPDGTWLARPGEQVRGNPTGAGDAVVAGLADGHVRGLPWPDRLRHAVALGAATVAAPAAGEYDEAEYARQLPLVRLSRAGPEPGAR